MGLIASSCKEVNSEKSRSPTKIYHLESFENACLELFASSPLVAKRFGSLYPGKVQSFRVLRALNNFATTKIDFAELFACEVTFLHMSVNCKEEKLTLSRRKVIFMGSILEQNFAATLVSNF